MAFPRLQWLTVALCATPLWVGDATMPMVQQLFVCTIHLSPPLIGDLFQHREHSHLSPLYTREPNTVRVFVAFRFLLPFLLPGSYTLGCTIRIFPGSPLKKGGAVKEGKIYKIACTTSNIGGAYITLNFFLKKTPQKHNMAQNVGWRLMFVWCNRCNSGPTQAFFSVRGKQVPKPPNPQKDKQVSPPITQCLSLQT